MKFKNVTPNSVLVLRRNGLGDLLCTVPLLIRLKQLYPQLHRTLVADARNACLLPYLEERCFEQALAVPRGNKYWQLLKLALRLNTQLLQPCWAISGKPTATKLYNLFLVCLRAYRKTAVINRRYWRLFLNDARPAFTNEAHQAAKLLALAEPERDLLTELPPELWPRLDQSSYFSAMKQKYGAMIEARLPKGQGPLLFLSVSNNREESSLSLEAYASVLNELYERRPFRVCISALHQQAQKGVELTRLLKAPATSVVLNHFDAFLQLLEACDLCFLGDGGNMHLAAALDKHQVVLFGQTDPKRWHPLSNKVVILGPCNKVADIEKTAMLQALESQLEACHVQA